MIFQVEHKTYLRIGKESSTKKTVFDYNVRHDPKALKGVCESRISIVEQHLTTGSLRFLSPIFVSELGSIIN